NIKTLYP
ncbi:hypothetical protein S40293_10294, partial [Stachybotrys chartarum IBT 40293]